MQVQARLDRSEMLWLWGALGKRCLQVAAGYDNGDDANLWLPHVVFTICIITFLKSIYCILVDTIVVANWLYSFLSVMNICKVFWRVDFCFPSETSDDIKVALCMEGHHWFTLETQRGGRGIEKEILTLISVGAANQSLLFQSKGCGECLWATEVRTERNCYVTRTRTVNLAHTLSNIVVQVWLDIISSQARLQQLGSGIRSKLLDRVQRLHHLLLAFRRQVCYSSY